VGFDFGGVYGFFYAFSLHFPTNHVSITQIIFMHFKNVILLLQHCHPTQLTNSS